MRKIALIAICASLLLSSCAFGTQPGESKTSATENSTPEISVDESKTSASENSTPEISFDGSKTLESQKSALEAYFKNEGYTEIPECAVIAVGAKSGVPAESGAWYVMHDNAFCLVDKANVTAGGDGNTVKIDGVKIQCDYTFTLKNESGSTVAYTVNGKEKALTFHVCTVQKLDFESEDISVYASVSNQVLFSYRLSVATNTFKSYVISVAMQSGSVKDGAVFAVDAESSAKPAEEGDWFVFYGGALHHIESEDVTDGGNGVKTEVNGSEKACDYGFTFKDSDGNVVKSPTSGEPVKIYVYTAEALEFEDSDGCQTFAGTVVS